MPAKTEYREYFLATLLLGAAGLSVYIFLPFISWLVLALVLAVSFKPLNQWIATKVCRSKASPTLSTSLTLLVIFLTVAIPLAIATASIFSEAQNITTFLTDDKNQKELLSAWNGAQHYFSKAFPSFPFDSADLKDLIAKIPQVIVSQLFKAFSNILNILIGIFISCLALFYFIRDGSAILKYLMSISPLEAVEEKALFSKIQKTVTAIFGGIILVCILQGIITGIGFALFGVPSPFLWGFVTIFAALVPVLGTGLVIFPGILYLCLIGHFYSAFGLFLWMLIPVGLADNILRPILMGHGMQIPSFLVLLAILGGMIVFGISGLLHGPIILAVLFAVIEIYINS
jgi:predicted PurR-regulated permease PerM